MNGSTASCVRLPTRVRGGPLKDCDATEFRSVGKKFEAYLREIKTDSNWRVSTQSRAAAGEGGTEGGDSVAGVKARIAGLAPPARRTSQER